MPASSSSPSSSVTSTPSQSVTTSTTTTITTTVVTATTTATTTTTANITMHSFSSSTVTSGSNVSPRVHSTRTLGLGSQSPRDSVRDDVLLRTKSPEIARPIGTGPKPNHVPTSATPVTTSSIPTPVIRSTNLTLSSHTNQDSTQTSRTQTATASVGSHSSSIITTTSSTPSAFSVVRANGTVQAAQLGGSIPTDTLPIAVPITPVQKPQDVTPLTAADKPHTGEDRPITLKHDNFVLIERFVEDMLKGPVLLRKLNFHNHKWVDRVFVLSADKQVLHWGPPRRVC